MGKMGKSDGKGLTLEDFIKYNKPSGTNSCTLHFFLIGMSPHDRDVVWQAIRDKSIQASAIHKVLKERGYKNTEQVIRKHRTHGCRVCGVEPLK